MPKYKDMMRMLELYPLMRYYEDLTAGLGQSWRTAAFSDIDVVVDSRTFPCHHIVLAAMSHYFRTMFNSGIVQCFSIQV